MAGHGAAVGLAATIDLSQTLAVFIKEGGLDPTKEEQNANKRDNTNSSTDKKLPDAQNILNKALKRQGLKEGDAVPSNFKEKWSEDGYDYEARIHPADPKQNNSGGDIFRIARRKQGTDANGQGNGWEYIDNQGTWHPERTLRPGNPNYNSGAAADTHLNKPTTVQ